jgi:hypothetical protein
MALTTMKVILMNCNTGLLKTEQSDKTIMRSALDQVPALQDRWSYLLATEQSGLQSDFIEDLICK